MFSSSIRRLTNSLRTTSFRRQNFSDDAGETLKKIIATNDVVVFSSDNCPYCAQAIDALIEAKKTPFVKKIGWEEREWLLDNTGSKSVPNIWIKGKFVGGCNDGPAPWMGIKKIIKAGTLEDYFK